MSDLARLKFSRVSAPLLCLAAGLGVQAHGGAQNTAQNTDPALEPKSPGRPIAIIPLDSKVPGHAAEITGGLLVNDGRAYVAANASITAGDEPAHVTLPYRGTLLVCASTNVKLAADTSNVLPGLMMAMEHGAVELSYAGTTANLQSADVLLTPDFRILIGGPGAAEVKVRLGNKGDTCVDNPGANGPYVVVSSVFEGGTYRVQPGQRVMFQHGSLHEVVDQEKESCGCPPSSKGNEFPVAQSMGLTPTPAAPAPAVNGTQQPQAQTVPPLVYQSKEKVPVAEIPAPQPARAPALPPVAAEPKPKPAPHEKRGFFGSIGHFFRVIFGAEE